MKLSMPSLSNTPGRLRLVTLAGMCAIVAAGLGRFYWAQSQAVPQRLFEEAEAALRQGQKAEVLAHIELLAPFDDYSPHRHFLQGSLHLREGRFEDALTELRFAQFHPRLEVPALIAIGQTLYQMRRASEAVDRWYRALALDPQAINAHRWLGVYFHDVGAMDNAKTHLETVAQLDPQDGRPHRLLGLIQRDYQMYNEAVTCYRESLRRNKHQPDHVDILMELAECEVKLHNYDAALEVLDQCPKSAKLLALTAECYLSLGQVAEADRFSAEALQAAPQDLEALELRGRILLQQGNSEQALRTFETALELHPKDYIVRLQLAQLYQRAGRTEEAKTQSELGTSLRDQWQKYARLHEEAIAHPDDAETRYQMGEMALELDRHDLAEQWFRATLQLQADHSLARRGLDNLYTMARQSTP